MDSRERTFLALIFEEPDRVPIDFWMSAGFKHKLESGLNILQSIQPEAAGMEPQILKAEFGKRLSFHGGTSIQKTMPFRTPAEVREEVKNRVGALATGGGYILCTSHNIQADTPLENVQALLEAYKDYGCYA